MPVLAGLKSHRNTWSMLHDHCFQHDENKATMPAATRQGRTVHAARRIHAGARIKLAERYATGNCVQNPARQQCSAQCVQQPPRWVPGDLCQRQK